MITEKDVTRFQEIYRRQFMREINKNDARMKLTFLVKQTELLFFNPEQSKYENGDENEQDTSGLHS